jgi:hypothetical protein
MKKLTLIVKSHWLLLGIVLMSFCIGIYHLDTLPGEMWGDAIAHYHLAQQVMHGDYFFDYRFGGDGPIYTYCVVFVHFLFGLSFFTLKFTSVIIAVVFVFVMYHFAYALFQKKEIAFVTAFLSSVSFYTIVFARQPHARMLVPLFIVVAIFFAMKKKMWFAGLFLGLGMYTQASYWAMPFVFLRRYKIMLTGFGVSLPLLMSFATGTSGFFTDTSYFGEKLAVSSHLSVDAIIGAISHNIIANFLSFFLTGDGGFRLNVPQSPHFDIVSAVFFFIGFILLVHRIYTKKHWYLLEFILLPLFIVQIPSFLDIHNPQAQPNIGRMIGIIPFVYVSIAYGLTISLQFVTKKLVKQTIMRKYISVFLLVIFLSMIATLNIYKYFILYPDTLPNHNTPFGKIIAQKIDSYPQSTSFIIIGSGWGEWGQPEQDAIALSRTKPHELLFIQPPVNPSVLCQNIVLKRGNSVFIINPLDEKSLAALQSCGITLKRRVVHKNNDDIADFIEIKSH